MNPLNHVDLAILGGGCAGLSLAKRLSTLPQWTKKTAIFEAREQYTQDRSWCFWEPNHQELAKYLAPIISHQWKKWRFSGKDFNQSHQVNGRDYAYIASQDFYQDALIHIDKHPTIELYTGVSVQNITQNDQGYLIQLSNNQCFMASQVIDTRVPTFTQHHQARLWQIFYGVEVELPESYFDETTVGLMDHLTASPDATQFIYILPFTDKRALIEITLFTPNIREPITLKPLLFDWIEQHIGINQPNILRTELACLPMGLNPVLNYFGPNYHYAGLGAGALRPATGYGFLRIQRWAERCANSLNIRQKPSAIIQSSRITRLMDSIFLRVLHDAPYLGVSFFKAFSEQVPADRLVRFLSDEASAKDYWAVLRSLPPLRFLIYGLGLHRLF